MSPRQKMINLMYIVLTAMLALNVSSDVLDGFTQVEDGLQKSNVNVSRSNDAVFATLAAAAEQNPEKAGHWHQKAQVVRDDSQQLINMIDSLKWEIVVQADGKNARPGVIDNREDTEAASVVMLNPVTNHGQQLRQELDRYRAFVAPMVTDSTKRSSIYAALTTEPFQRKGMTGQSREESKNENQPEVTAITLLTKLQNDIRYAEGEALNSLLSNVDAGDVRVNEINAFVIPQSRYVMRGGQYTANIVLAAVDTTARPSIFIGDKQLPDNNGIYQITTTSSGTYDYSGHLEVTHGDGTVTRHPFSSSYVVMDPAATVSATMMNVLYAGIDNPISISVPGVPQQSVSATMTNGSLTRQGDGWVARPGKPGDEAVIAVSATIDGRPQQVSSYTFRVRRLPDPTPYLALGSGQGDRYKGGKPITKAQLLDTKSLSAAIDDDMLDIDFKVLGFETVIFDAMGNAIPEVSDGANFSSRQQASFKRLSRGKRFYISRIRAMGPDNVERTLSPMEVIVN